MQAVILAGGLGTRLYPITKTIPKPMVTVAGAPYLEHQLRELRRQEILDILLLTGYLGEQIEEYFGDGSRLGLRIRYSKEPKPLGTGGALRLAQNLLEDCFLLLYGDSYLPIDYREVLRGLQNSPADGLVVVYDNRIGDTTVRSNINLDKSNFVSRYEKDAAEQLSYVEAGVLAFRKAVVNLIAPEQVVSLEQEIFPQLIQQRSLLGFPTQERFYDIGTPDRLQAFEARISS